MSTGWDTVREKQQSESKSVRNHILPTRRIGSCVPRLSITVQWTYLPRRGHGGGRGKHLLDLMISRLLRDPNALHTQSSSLLLLLRGCVVIMHLQSQAWTTKCSPNHREKYLLRRHALGGSRAWCGRLGVRAEKGELTFGFTETRGPTNPSPTVSAGRFLFIIGSHHHFSLPRPAQPQGALTSIAATAGLLVS